MNDNQICTNNPQFCFKCLQEKHNTHLNDCQRFGDLFLLIKSQISDTMRPVDIFFQIMKIVKEKCEESCKITKKKLDQLMGMERALKEERYYDIKENIEFIKNLYTTETKRKNDYLQQFSQHIDHIKEQCEEQKQVFLKNSENLSELYYQKGVKLLHLQQWGKALVQFDLALTQNQKNYNAIARAALRLLDKYDDSLKVLEEGLKLNANHSQLNAQFGIIIRYFEAIYYQNLIIIPEHQSILKKQQNQILKILKGIMGRVLQQEDKFGDALKMHEKAIQINPYCSIYFADKAFTLYSLKKFNEAIQCCEKGLLIDPLSFNLRYYKAISLQNIDQQDEAIACFETIVGFVPQNFYEHNVKGCCLQLLKKYDDALQCFDLAIQLNPYSADAVYEKGNTLFYQGKYEEAILCYEKTIEINSSKTNKVRALYSKGWALQNLKKYDEALKCQEEALILNPKHLDALIQKGIIYCLQLGYLLQFQELYQDSLKCLEKAIEQDSSIYCDVNIKQGESLQMLKRYEEAIKCYNEAILLDQNFKESYIGKGNSLYYLKNYQESIQQYEIASKIDANYTISYYNKGLALGQLKQIDEAINFYNQALQLDPNYMDAWYSKGISLLFSASALEKLGKNEELLECYNQILKLNPKCPLILISKVVTLKKLNRFWEASKCKSEYQQIKRLKKKTGF